MKNIDRLIELVKNWKKDSEKYKERYDKMKMGSDYFEGQVKAFENVLEVLEMYK